jgi:fructokinase
MEYRFGIDLGGTKIELIALDETGATRECRRVPTPQGNYEKTIISIADMIKAAETKIGPACASHPPSIGIGIPGNISPATGLIKNANSTCLIGKPLEQDLQQALGRPVRIANDADCFTLSEAVDGTGSEARIVFGIILGTGVGGGLAINKSIVRGPNAITGEWGHNSLPWPGEDEHPGPKCYCGHFGCIETFLSGPGLVLDANNNKGNYDDAFEVVKDAAEGNPIAHAALQHYTERLAKALASVINVIDPEVIVLGGGLSNIRSLYEDVPALWNDFVFSDSVATQLLPPKHGDSSGVRGAAWLWPSQRFSPTGLAKGAG